MLVDTTAGLFATDSRTRIKNVNEPASDLHPQPVHYELAPINTVKLSVYRTSVQPVLQLFKTREAFLRHGPGGSEGPDTQDGPPMDHSAGDKQQPKDDEGSAENPRGDATVRDEKRRKGDGRTEEQPRDDDKVLHFAFEVAAEPNGTEITMFSVLSFYRTYFDDEDTEECLGYLVARCLVLSARAWTYLHHLDALTLKELAAFCFLLGVFITEAKEHELLLPGELAVISEVFVECTNLLQKKVHSK